MRGNISFQVVANMAYRYFRSSVPSRYFGWRNRVPGRTRFILSITGWRDFEFESSFVLGGIQSSWCPRMISLGFNMLAIRPI